MNECINVKHNKSYHHNTVAIIHHFQKELIMPNRTVNINIHWPFDRCWIYEMCLCDCECEWMWIQIIHKLQQHLKNNNGGHVSDTK